VEQFGGRISQVAAGCARAGAGARGDPRIIEAVSTSATSGRSCFWITRSDSREVMRIVPIPFAGIDALLSVRGAQRFSQSGRATGIVSTFCVDRRLTGIESLATPDRATGIGHAGRCRGAAH
jgi:hypothetical protein